MGNVHGVFERFLGLAFWRDNVWYEWSYGWEVVCLRKGIGQLGIWKGGTLIMIPRC